MRLLKTLTCAFLTVCSLCASAETKPDAKKAEKPQVQLPGVAANAVLAAKTTNVNVIRTTGEGTENALISKRFTNRISTPFEHPRVIDSSSVTMQIDASSIFVSPKTDDPFAIYVTGGNPGDPVISLTLIPKDIPAQTIALQIDSSQGASHRPAKVESYTQQIVELLKNVAIGKTPEGYSEGAMPSAVVLQNKNGLNIYPEIRYSGSNFDIYKYKVENNQEDIELSETSFYQKGVRAVSITPNVYLKKGESTSVFVLADKSILDGNDNGK